MSKYLDFKFIGNSESGKTKIWGVDSKSSGYRLGWIKWFGRWRQYCFYPEQETVFNHECLDDIKNFLLTEAQK